MNCARPPVQVHPSSGEVVKTAERAVLGAVLSNPAFALPALRELGLTDGEFENALHGRVFTAAVAVYEDSGSVETLALAAHLSGDRQLAERGGIVFLAALATEAATATNVKIHAELVLIGAHRRR